jgi:hypothetical protein
MTMTYTRRWVIAAAIWNPTSHTIRHIYVLKAKSIYPRSAPPLRLSFALSVRVVLRIEDVIPLSHRPHRSAEVCRRTLSSTTHLIAPRWKHWATEVALALISDYPCPKDSPRRYSLCLCPFGLQPSIVTCQTWFNVETRIGQDEYPRQQSNREIGRSFCKQER